MNRQTVSSEYWEVRLSEDWIRGKASFEGEIDFEAPYKEAGAYISTCCTSGESLFERMRNTRDIEWRELSRLDPDKWSIGSRSDNDRGESFELQTGYLDLSDSYRIISRMLGCKDHYVRFTFHDYWCTDTAESDARSAPWVASLSLRNQDCQ